VQARAGEQRDEDGVGLGAIVSFAARNVRDPADRIYQMTLGLKSAHSE
jgi:hypothetical protein